MTSIAVENGHLVLRDRAVVVVRNGLDAEVKGVERLIEQSTMLLGRELPSLRQLFMEVNALFKELDAAQAVGMARVRLSETATMHFQRALYRIRVDEVTCATANALRVRLGASPSEMLPRTSEVARVAAELPLHVGDALRPRTLAEWIHNESSPRLDLVRKTCTQFLDTGEWLRLGVEMKAWRRLGLVADIAKEAEAMWGFGRVDGDRFRANVEAFTLVPEARPYLDRVLALIRLGIRRFSEGANREPAQRLVVTEPELAAIMGDLPVDKFMRFVGLVSRLGFHLSAPSSWVPHRDILEYYPAETYEDLVAVESLVPKRLGTGEQCLWLLRIIADSWMETRAWPSVDGLLADQRVGPGYYFALKSLRWNWINVVDDRFAALDLDGLILGLSRPDPVVSAVATIVGTLADELVADEKADVARIERLTGLDGEFVRRLLPLLERPDLGLSIHGTASEPQAYALSSLFEYLDVRTPASLSAEWPRNCTRHPAYSRAVDKERLNVFGVKTLRDRMLALGARGGDVQRSEESTASRAGPKPELSVCARLLGELDALGHSDVSPQDRGLELERIVFEVLKAEKLDPERRLIRPGEEIDLSFTLLDRHYLVECKWLKEPVDTPTVQSFMVKVRTKAEGSFGVFLSMSGFVGDIDDKIVVGQRLNVVGLGPSHLLRVLQERTTWSNLVREAVKLASLRACFKLPEEEVTARKAKGRRRSPAAGKPR
ncbi:MAG: hypothetical protein F9K40_01690 [Kofleriaceae bacterium]|nr:MAG: hypothetical protein F9K40_01690 [Kofleriaceae bacterium]